MAVQTGFISCSLIPALLAAAAVEGVVKDPSGAAIPGAAVILKNSETAQAENALTDARAISHLRTSRRVSTL